MIRDRSALKNINLFILYSIYFGLYLIIYSSYISDIYGYMGYANDLSLEKIPAAAAGVAVCLWLTGREDLPSGFFLHVVLALIYIPTMVIFCGGNLPYILFFVTSIAFILLAFVARFIRLPRVRISEISEAKLLKFLATISITTILAVIIFGGWRFINFDISAVYDFRGEAADNLPSIFGYINPAVGKIIIPFGIVIAILMRKWLYVAILCGCLIMMFALTSHKSLLLYPLLVLFIYYISGKRKCIEIFLIALIVIGLISLLEFTLLKSIGEYWFSSLLIRRALFVPSLLNWFYIDWFSSHNFYYWADSKLSFGLIDAPNTLKSVNLIGLQYFGEEGMSANTGWIGSGFANAGILGVVLYSLLVGLIFSLLNSYARTLGRRLIISLFFIIIFAIVTSTDLMTSLFTHGLLVAFLLISILSPTRFK